MTAASLIVSALLRRGGRILLVEQQGPWDPEPRWMLPGGRVEADEARLAALEREVAEESGLALQSVARIAFAVEVETDDGRYLAFTFECEADGDPAPADPDGFVRGAAWIDEADAIDRLRRTEWYDCTPLSRYLAGEATAGAVYRLRLRR